jgi:hypothetical protein
MKIQLAGRLGNQLFIWAFAVDMAKSHNRPVVIFTDKYHNMSRSSVEIEDLISSESDIEICEINSLGLLLKVIDKVATYSTKLRKFLNFLFRIKTQESPYVDPIIKNKTPSIIRGYFQSSTFAQKNRTKIEAALNPVLLKNFQEIKSRMSSEHLDNKYQCIHIRKGDYVANPQLGELSATYYLQNLDANLPIIICTDANELPREFSEAFPRALCLNTDNSTAWEALAVMANSAHLVTANSTLSWWGGFIAVSRGAVVITPEPWFKSVYIPKGHFLGEGMTISKANFN